MTRKWQHELDVAIGAVREGAVLARDIRRQIGRQALLKADRSPVTVADFAIQALVACRLRQAFPDDPLVAEEDASSLRRVEGRQTRHAVRDRLRRAIPDLSSDQLLEAIDSGRAAPGERFWALDPVDGTEGFVRGGQYVVALALIVQGRVEIGLLGCPQLALSDKREDGVGTVVYAVRGGGAFCSSLTADASVRLGVSSCREPRQGRVLRSVEAGHIDLRTFNEVVEALGVEAAPVLMDSQAKHAVIAAGRADLLIRIPAAPDFRDKIWDQAAGSIVIEEAGGRVTDLRGQPLDFTRGRTLARNEGMVASNGHLHDSVLEVLRSQKIPGSSEQPAARHVPSPGTIAAVRLTSDPSDTRGCNRSSTRRCQSSRE